MEKKKVLVLDRNYCLKYMQSDYFEVIVVCMTPESKKIHEKQGLHVIGCFEEEYDSLPVASYSNAYLAHSFDCDRFLNRYSYEKRLEILGKEISFWEKILDNYKPSCIVNEVVTIEFMEVMYLEAQKRGIPYYTWGFVPFAPKDIWVSEPPFNTRMSEGFWNSVNETQADLEQARNYIQQTREKGHKPFYIVFKRRNALVGLLQSFKSYILGLSRHIQKRISQKFCYEDEYYQRLLFLKYAWSFCLRKYDDLTYDSNTEYFFYPLHLEPESAVEYAGYHFNDQVMLIGRIAHTLQLNQKLIIKEHPQQKGVLLTRKFQELKKKYPNLVFAPVNVSSYDIYPKVKCVVTLNGTAGFEAWVCKKPVIIFGEVFYKDFPGITCCDSFNLLYDIIRNEHYNHVGDNVIDEYVAKICHLLTNTFPYIDSNGLYKQEDCDSIAKQIESKLMAYN